MEKTIKTAQQVKERDYPSVEDIAAYAEALQTYLLEGKVKGKEEQDLIKNLPDAATIRSRFSLEEAKVLFHTLGHLWHKLTGRDILEDSKIEPKKEALSGNYWLINKGILLSGTNHFTMVKQNMELFRILLNIHAFALHEKIASPPNELIKLVLDHGGIRMFITKDKKFYCQMTGETYAKWGKRKVKKYDFPKIIVKVIDSSKPYRGWKSGIAILL